MPPLRELQQDVMDALFERASPAARHVRRRGLPPPRRLAIYRHNVFDSLGTALAAVYPTIVQLVGDGFFAYAAHAFILEHPPRTGNLHDFGEPFPEFLEAFVPARQLPYLGDCARLDWAWHAVFHSDPGRAQDAAAVLARIASIPTEQRAALTLRWQPAARLVASPYPVLRIWRMHHRADGPASLDLGVGGECVLVAARAGEVFLQPLSAGEHALLAGLQRGDTLGNAVAAGLQCEPTLDATSLVARHLVLGTLVGLGEPA